MIKILHGPVSRSLHFLSSGFLAFKKRISQELQLRRGVNLEDFAEDDTLYAFYLHGEPEDYVLDALCGNASDD